MRDIVQHTTKWWYPFPEKPPGPRMSGCLVAIDGVSHAAVWNPSAKEFIGVALDPIVDTSAVSWWTVMPEAPA